MKDSERRHLELWSEEASDAARLFSNEGMTRQERTAVAGLLRGIGLTYRNDEILKRGPEPVDIWFRDARFQVTEILDPGRARNREIQKRADRASRARRLEDLLEPISFESRPLSTEEFLALAAQRCDRKASRYGGNVADVDLLIYVNQQKRHFFCSDWLPSVVPKPCGRWRSVSIIMATCAVVVAARDSAPDFLRERRGKCYPWKDSASIFPVLLDDLKGGDAPDAIR